MKTFGIPLRYVSFGAWAVMTTSSRPSSRLASGDERHPAAEDARVARRDGVARERSLVTAVGGVREPDGLPASEGPQRRVDVDELALDDLRCVREVLDIRVEAVARDAEEGAAVDLRDVDGLRVGVGEELDRRVGSRRDPELAREVVAAPAGQHAEDALAAAESVGDRPGEPVPAEAHGHFVALRRALAQLDRVLERDRQLDPVLEAVPLQRRLDLGEVLGGTPATGLRVHDEAEAPHAGR